MSEGPAPQRRPDAGPATPTGAKPAPDDALSSDGAEGPPAANARRPPAVTILAILQLLGGLGYGLVTLALLIGGSAVLEAVAGRILVVGGLARDLETAFVVVVMGTLCAAGLAAGVLLLRMRRLGWTITMLMAGLALATSVYLWWTEGTRLELWLLIQILTVFYLNQRQVRHAFGITGGRVGSTLVQGRG